MAGKLSIFLTGATGYIGGSVLWRLINHKDAKNFSIKVLVRNAEKAKLLQEKFGVEAVTGTHENSDKLEALAQEADVVINTTTTDGLEATKALLRGLKKNYEKSGKVPIYIHTSGTGVNADNAEGQYATDRIYDDSKIEDIESLDPKTQLHRIIDIEVVAADQATYIILPSTIYGVAKSGLTEAGIQNPYSIQVPGLIITSLACGQGGMVGLGKNIWTNVHIGYVADLYIILFDKARSDPERVPHGREGFFFGAFGEHALYDVGKAISQALVDIGEARVPSRRHSRRKSWTNTLPFLGSNARCVANRSLALGWKPTHTTKDFLASVKPGMEALITSGKDKQIPQPK